MQEYNSDQVDIQEIIYRLERLVEYFERKQKGAKIHDEKEFQSPHSLGN